MSTKTRCRRSSSRIALDSLYDAVIEFGYPTPGGHPCSMPLKEISPSGLSFMLAHELPGIEVGRALERVKLKINGHTVRGDLVVMHLTPDENPGSVCGGLFHPWRDSDILNLEKLIQELEAAFPHSA